jgi:hypothetical protein
MMLPFFTHPTYVCCHATISYKVPAAILRSLSLLSLPALYLLAGLPAIAGYRISPVRLGHGYLGFN